VATTGPVRALGGLVQFNNLALALTPGGLSATGQATVDQMGNASFQGSIDAAGTYALHAQANVTVAGLTLDGATLDLGAQELRVGATTPIPGVSPVGFQGSYGPGG
jgi:hypothetical protein